jgi:phosphoglucomutase
MDIKFGTSGWRGIIAEDITFGRLRVVTQAIADYFKQEGLHNKQVIVGYDTRFLSEQFAQSVANVLAANGLETLLTNRDTPTPVIAFEIIRQKAAGGLNITASHNPSAYSGLKFNTSWGGPALPSVTEQIEMTCDDYITGDSSPKVIKEAAGVKRRLIVQIDPKPAYFKHLETLIDVKAIKKGKLKVVVDGMWGAGRGYLDEFLRQAGAEVTAIHQDRDVLYGGHGPSPELEALGGLRDAMKKSKSPLGLATDGDADRFGIMDEDGSLISPNEFLPILLDHLVKTRGWTGVVARSVMTTHFLDAVAKHHGLEVKETPVGFKYIGEMMQQENAIYPSTAGTFLMGGEESGGVSIRGHVPEKDGILACLLAAEIVAVTKKPLRHYVNSLQKEVGTVITERMDFRLPVEKMITLREELKHRPPTRFGPLAVRRIVETDGHKFILTDGSWIGVRLSGTEPVVRVYLEAHDAEKMKQLEKAGRGIAGVKEK